MTNRDLIEKLKQLPQDAEVGYVWDGCIRSTVQFVWLARDGQIALADYNHYVSADQAPANPQGAGFVKKEIYGPIVHWETPEDPEYAEEGN